MYIVCTYLMKKRPCICGEKKLPERTQSFGVILKGGGSDAGNKCAGCSLFAPQDRSGLQGSFVRFLLVMGSELTATNFMLQRLERHIKEDLPLLYLPA